MKAIIVFLLALPLSVPAQIALSNSSFSNGFGTGSDGVNTVKTLLGSSSTSFSFDIPPPPPSINSFLPESGPVGTSVTISGENFSTLGDENIVYFGVVRALVTSSTETEITASVPINASHHPITVTTNGLTAFSNKPFDVILPLDGGQINPGSFQPAVDLPTGINPFSVALGDIDVDGKIDLIVANINSNTISLYRNNSISGAITASSFSDKVDFATADRPYIIAVGDIDGDGKPDIAVPNNGTNTVSVFRNTSAIGSITSASLSSRIDFITGDEPIQVAISDLDLDGKSDLAVTSQRGGSIAVLRNISAGSITTNSFAPKIDFVVGNSPIGVAIADFDGDKKPDLAITNEGPGSLPSGTVSVLKNNTTKGTINTTSFASKVDFAAGVHPRAIITDDLDGDNKPDIAVANFGGSTVSLFRNTHSTGDINLGSFGSKIDLPAGNGPISIAPGDLDGDGRTDLAVANEHSNTLSVLKNVSNPGSLTTTSFENKIDFATGNFPISVTAGDFNNDSKPDLAVTNLFSHTVSILGNKRFQKIEFSQLNASTYGDDAFTLQGTASSGLPVAYTSSNTSVATINGNIATIIGAGEAFITASQPGNEVFGKALDVNQALTVSKALLTATAENKTRSYGDENPELTIQYSGLKGAETSAIIDTHPLATTVATSSSDVDTYAITLTEATDNNYTIQTINGSLTIAKAPLTATAEDKTKMYGETSDPLLGITYSGFKGLDDESVLDISATASTNVTATSDAGDYDIIPAGGSDNNYTFSYVYGIYTVNKLTLTATADDKTKNYGEDNPLLTITYTGFTGSENAGVVDLDPTISTSAIKQSAPGTYPITLDGGSDNNYDFSLLNGILTINPLSTPVGGKPTSTCYLTSPANNALNVNYYATLTANMVVGAKLYTMEANIHPDFSGLSIVKQGASKDIVFILDYNTQYYVRVKTDLAPDEWSVTSTFITGDPVSLAYVTSPRDGGTGVPGNVKVTANLLHGATSYTIELNTSPDFTGISMVNSDESRTISFKGLAKATTYFARVTSDLRPGEWGLASSFSTINPAGRGREDWMSEAEIDLETEGIAYSIFPNPFKGHVTIHVQSLAQVPLEMTLFDINGKTLEQTSSMTNRLVKIGETVVTGVYILRIATPKGIKNIRLVKF